MRWKDTFAFAKSSILSVILPTAWFWSVLYDCNWFARQSRSCILYVTLYSNSTLFGAWMGVDILFIPKGKWENVFLIQSLLGWYIKYFPHHYYKIYMQSSYLHKVFKGHANIPNLCIKIQNWSNFWSEFSNSVYALEGVTTSLFTTGACELTAEGNQCTEAVCCAESVLASGSVGSWSWSFMKMLFSNICNVLIATSTVSSQFCTIVLSKFIKDGWISNVKSKGVTSVKETLCSNWPCLNKGFFSTLLLDLLKLFT